MLLYSPAALSDDQIYIGLDYATGRYIGMDNTDQIDGGRATLGYSKDRWWWHDLQLLFEGSVTYYHSDYEPLDENYKDNLWVFAAAPTVRYHVLPQRAVDLFFDISVGPAYLSTTRFESRNLGIHYTFQDMLGAGVLWGERHQYSVALRIVHYSNACIDNNNRGFTIPVILSLGYEL